MRAGPLGFTNGYDTYNYALILFLLLTRLFVREPELCASLNGKFLP